MGTTKKNIVVMTLVALVAVVAVAGVTVGLRNTVGELAVEIGQSPVEAILASADVADETVVTVPILYYDQTMDPCVNIYDMEKENELTARQFEWSDCGYYNKAMEQGLVEARLNDEYLPVATEGELISNRGVGGENFGRWFSTVEGKSQSYPGSLALRYNAGTASFSYENDIFYPLNQIAIPAEMVNRDGNNHLFTLNLGVPVQIIADGNESFSVAADDDTWVFVGDRLVLDMGGIHDVKAARFKVMAGGEIYTAVGDEDLGYSGVNVTPNTGTVVRIFHADRNSDESVFRINFANMLLNVTDDATLSRTERGEGQGTTVAYNPEDPAYVAPLGESLVYQPNRSRMILASAIVQALSLGVLSVFLVAVISVAWRYARRDRNRE